MARGPPAAPPPAGQQQRRPGEGSSGRGQQDAASCEQTAEVVHVDSPTQHQAGDAQPPAGAAAETAQLPASTTAQQAAGLHERSPQRDRQGRFAGGPAAAVQQSGERRRGAPSAGDGVAGLKPRNQRSEAELADERLARQLHQELLAQERASRRRRPVPPVEGSMQASKAQRNVQQWSLIKEHI